MSIHSPIDLLMQWVKERPNEPYLHQPVNGQWRSYTWSEVADQAQRMATALKALDLAPGARVAISGMNTAHWYMADAAITMAGCVTVGLYPNQAPEHVSYILEHSETQVLFLGPMPDIDSFLKAVPPGIRVVQMPYPGVPEQALKWSVLVQEHAPLTEMPQPKPDQLMTLIYTSGTTGHPKGVMVSYGNMMFAADGLIEAMPSRGRERLLCYLPLAHAFERGAVELTSMVLGAQVYFIESVDKLQAALQYARPTRFFGVPLVYNRIQSGVLRLLPQHKIDRLMRIPILSGIVKRKVLKGLGLDKAHLCIVGAAPMPIPLLEWFDKIGLTVFQGYGMTENAIYATTNRPGMNRIGSVGKTMPGAHMKIADDGEILFRHGAVMQGYYKEPEKTRETFTDDGWLKTGDVGRVDADGYLFITGRVKEIFKTAKGKYVAPAPIEGQLARNHDIDQVCFVGSNLKQPIMLVSLNEDARKKSREEVEAGLIRDMDAVNATLEPHEAIAKMVVVKDSWSVDNGLATPTFKVRRAQVEQRYGELLEAESQVRNKLSWEA
ncbi:MAG: AMP-binding protein [Gammaproteobacteria bacterium]|nr:AMP-binding protein [Gammaproteobacteria bacterium]